MLFLLGSKAIDLYVLMAISAAAMVNYRPNREELLNLVREEQMRVATGGNVG